MTGTVFGIAKETEKAGFGKNIDFDLFCEIKSGAKSLFPPSCHCRVWPRGPGHVPLRGCKAFPDLRLHLAPGPAQKLHFRPGDASFPCKC